MINLESLTEEVEAPDTDPDQAEDEDSDPEIRELEGNAQNAQRMPYEVSKKALMIGLSEEL